MNEPFQKCSYCGNENRAGSAHCSRCGTATRSPTIAMQGAAFDREQLFGVLWLLGGVVVTAISYFAAASGPGGGTYVVAWGAMLYGARKLFLTHKRSNGSAQERLHCAAMLEGIDRNQAVSKYEEIIRLFPGTSASREAKRNIEVLMGKPG